MTAPRSRRVLVLNGFGNNLGDQAIFAGFADVFGEAVDRAGLDVTLDQSFVYDFPFRRETIETLNAHYDLVVLGGGGILYHRPQDGSPSGWGFDIPQELLRTLTVPYAVYSTGYNYRAYASEHFPAHTAAHVRETVRRAAHFSVREPGSIRMMRERFGVDGGVELVPDCALHVEPARVHLPQLAADRPTIGLCLRLDRAQERFAPPFAQSFEHFVRTMIDSLRAMIERDGCQVVFTPHLLTPNDVEVGELLKASLPAGSIVLLHEAMPALYTGASLERPSLLAGVYQRCAAVLGQRLHSLIVPFAVGTPVVSVASTASSAWMQEYFGVDARFHLDLTRPETDVTVERMTGALREAIAERMTLSEHAFVRRGELVSVARERTRELVDRTLARPAAAAEAPRFVRAS